VGDKEATALIKRGFQLIYRSIERADEILGKKLKITINGSLADIYQNFFPSSRLIVSPNDAEKVSVLADIMPEFLVACGIQTT
jgi:hypothetical protein